MQPPPLPPPPPPPPLPPPFSFDPSTLETKKKRGRPKRTEPEITLESVLGLPSSRTKRTTNEKMQPPPPPVETLFQKLDIHEDPAYHQEQLPEPWVFILLGSRHPNMLTAGLLEWIRYIGLVQLEARQCISLPSPALSSGSDLLMQSSRKFFSAGSLRATGISYPVAWTDFW